MNTRLTQILENKRRDRREWQHASFEDKIAALIRMQAMAQEMAAAAGRRFDGVVWNPTGFEDSPR